MVSKEYIVTAFWLGAAASAVGCLIFVSLLAVAAPYLNRLLEDIKKRLEK